MASGPLGNAAQQTKEKLVTLRRSMLKKSLHGHHTQCRFAKAEGIRGKFGSTAVEGGEHCWQAMHCGKVHTSTPAVTAEDRRHVQIPVNLGYPKLRQEN